MKGTLSRLLFARASRFEILAWAAMVLAYGWVTFRFYRMFIYEYPARTVWGMADDVYITASFGRTLFEGHGPVWYPGAPPVEGYTSPLWVLVLGALHIFPFLEEHALGAWVLTVNLVLIAVAAWVFVRILKHLSAEAQSPPWRLWLALPLTLGGGSLCYWAAEGYEVVLVLLWALVGFLLVLQPLTRRSAIFLGVVLGLGFWTRMDAAIYFTGTLLVLLFGAVANRRVREICIAIGVAAVMAAALFICRYGYYGEWLPNTYYLKATNWPLAHRLDMGTDRDASLFPAVGAVWLLLLIPSVWRRLGPQTKYVAACFFIFTLSVAYSVYNGGDAWRLKGGHDRYTVIGGVFLLLGLSVTVVTMRLRAALVPLLALLCIGFSLAPVVFQKNWNEFYRARVLDSDPPRRWRERKWIRHGEVFERISKPGARIAVCPAGAIIYFSHRGGVDLFGKIEPYVARLKATKRRPPNARCWRNTPGHNKEDDDAVFALRNPDFSRQRPPVRFKHRYRKIQYMGERYFVRRDTKYLRLQQ